MKTLFNNVLVAISGSDASINASKYAIMISKIYKCKLTAIYVVDTATLKELLISKIFVEDESVEYEQSLVDNGHRYLNYIEELALKKGVNIDKLLRNGSIYAEILKASEEVKADLIILGGWEQNRNMRDLISHSHKEVLMNAKASVLVVKEQHVDKLYNQL
jgi:nucleotide-binding universal stress UspA family protein